MGVDDRAVVDLEVKQEDGLCGTLSVQVLHAGVDIFVVFLPLLGLSFSNFAEYQISLADVFA